MPKKIALFSIGWAQDLMHDYAKGVVKRMQGLDVDLYIFTCYPSYISEVSINTGELNIFNLPNLEDFDGALIVGNSIDHPGVFESIIDSCKVAKIPAVTTGRRDEYAYFVGSDNTDGARCLYTHLVEKHKIKSILFIAGHESNEDSNLRLAILREVMEEHGLDTNTLEVFYSQWEPKVAMEYIHYKYQDEGTALPDAIVCANDNLATSVCVALEELGFEVPQDTIVAGFDNIYTAEIYSPSITSVDQRFEDIGGYAFKILLDVIDGNARNRELYIGCDLFISESCGCECTRDLNYIRRMQGKSVFYNSMMTSIFERDVSLMEGKALASSTYEEFETNFREAISTDNTFIGKTFHLVMEPAYKQSMTDVDTKFLKKGYSDKMNVVFSMENGVIADCTEFETRKLVPSIDPKFKNRVFVFVPLHEVYDNYGYMVFGDNVDIVANGNHLFEFVSRINIILSKVRQNVSLRVLNRRLTELTETDVLTRVKNRAAYTSKEAELNSEISSRADKTFALGIFDINNLKKINDSLGHEAGDEYIVNCCSTLCKIFRSSPVYRIGGDEFAILLQGDDFEARDELIRKLKSRMKEIADSDQAPEKLVSIAGGIGVYDQATDDSVSDVFARADAAMYEDKTKMKECKL